MNNISFKKVAENIITDIKNKYQNYIVIQNDPYKEIVFNKNGITITIYKSKSVLFQGYNADKEAKLFFEIDTNKNNESSDPEQINYFKSDVIGNDEVGVGDVFGPLVVTATYLPSDSIDQLKQMQIKDSKKMTTEQINKIAPVIKKMVKSVTIVVDNVQYNNWYDQYQNAHVIKALAHNLALVELIKKHQLTGKTIYIDQFVHKNKYFEYLQNVQPIISDHLVFLTKGEDKSLAIACSAILSRETFLKSIATLETTYNIKLPLGASENVKALAQHYKNTMKNDQLQHFIKLHFNLNPK